LYQCHVPSVVGTDVSFILPECSCSGLECVWWMVVVVKVVQLVGVNQLWCWCCMARRNAPTAIECCYLVFPNESRPISVVMECKGAE
jgi:hypothetical protein